MAKPRNIDIVKVPKKRATRSSAPSLDIRLKPKASKPKVTKPTSQKPVKKYKKVPRKQRAGFFEVQASAISSVFSADIFQIAFVRNLFSLRVLFFAVLPIVVYQLRYYLVLKPDELLASAKSVLTPENTTNILVFGLVVVTIALISWLADTLITPSIIRYRFGRLDNRATTMSRSVREASSEVLHNVGQKLVKVLVFLGIVLISLVLCYVAYVLGYGSFSQQTGFFAGLSGMVGIILVYYFALRFWLQVITSVGGTAEHSRIGLAFKQLFYHPITSFGYGLGWLVSLVFSIFVCFAVVAGVLYGLDNTNSISLHILLLAGSTTLFCVIWTAWTAWQNGYWTKMIHSRSRTIPLVLSQLDELKYWRFLVLIIIVLAAISIYVVLAFVFSEQIYTTMKSLESILPETFKLNLPKPQ